MVKEHGGIKHVRRHLTVKEIQHNIWNPALTRELKTGVVINFAYHLKPRTKAIYEVPAQNRYAGYAVWYLWGDMTLAQYCFGLIPNTYRIKLL